MLGHVQFYHLYSNYRVMRLFINCLLVGDSGDNSSLVNQKFEKLANLPDCFEP